MTTFPDLLARELRADSGRPLVTFYDLGSGERVELSVATYANWVAKTASLLAEECDLARGQRLLVDLPTHWLTPVFLGAAWTVGLTVVWDEDDAPADGVVCGPAALTGWSGAAAGRPVVATALLPLGVRFPEPVPAGVVDYGVEIWGQPDAFVPWETAEPTDLAIPGTEQGELWRAAAAGSLLAGAGFTDGGRLLTEDSPASPSGLASFVEPLARSGSLVLVVPADGRDADARLDATYAAERATARQSARS
ncbi:MAG: TIGR03089 family protein [Nocardioides sp.]